MWFDTKTAERLQALAISQPALTIPAFAAAAGISRGLLDRYLATSWLSIVNPHGGSFTCYIVADNWMQDELSAWFRSHPEIVSDICDGGPGSRRRLSAQVIVRNRAGELEALRARISA